MSSENIISFHRWGDLIELSEKSSIPEIQMIAFQTEAVFPDGAKVFGFMALNNFLGVLIKVGEEYLDWDTTCAYFKRCGINPAPHNYIGPDKDDLQGCLVRPLANFKEGHYGRVI